MAWAEIVKLAAEIAKEGTKEITKQTVNEGVKPATPLDVRKPTEYIGTKDVNVKPLDGLRDRINLDKRINRDVPGLKSNVSEINGYKFTVDNKGRTVSAEGKLELKPETGRNKLKQKEAGGKDRLETDDGGHLIGRQFGGVGEKNLVAQDSILNKGPYNRLETKWAKAIKNGDEVFVRIDPKYSGNSLRPDSFKVSYSIDGEKFKTTFSNKPNAYAK